VTENPAWFAGNTPMVFFCQQYLAQNMRERRKHPGIMDSRYGRRRAMMLQCRFIVTDPWAVRLGLVTRR